ncbi:LexA family protein [Pueribacillus theae]
MKRVKKTEQGVFLYPDNPKYHPILITNGNARICGKVVQVIFEPK